MNIKSVSFLKLETRFSCFETRFVRVSSILPVLFRHAVACPQTRYFLFKVRRAYAIKKKKNRGGFIDRQRGRGGGKEKKRTKTSVYRLVTQRSLALCDWSKGFEKHKSTFEDLVETVNLTLRRTRKVIPPPWYKGGGVGPPPPPRLGFLICCNISKRFCLQWKAFILLYKMRYILWAVFW